MAKFKISEIIEATAGKLLQGNPRLALCGVATNSRLVKKGDLFIAIVGEKHDAHTFIPDVIKKGAAGIVVSRDIRSCPSSVAVIKVADTTKALGDIARFHRLCFSLPVIAITGSAGKTTTKEMIAALLRNKYKVLKNIGTENNQFGVPLTLLKLKKSDDIAVLEVGTNHPGDIKWLASIVCPTVVVMTNIGESHLALLKTPADVFKEKLDLVKALGRDGVVIVNRDNPFLRRIPRRLTPRALTFGIRAKAKLQARDIECNGAKLRFVLSGVGAITMPGTATANVYNALAAITCARLFKISVKDIKGTLGKFLPTSGRQSYIKAGSILILDDSYNANPVSFRSALEAISHHKTGGRRILICGDMLELGVRAKWYHQEIGARSSRAGLSTVISFGNFSRWIGLEAHRRNAEIEIFHSSKEKEIEAQIRKYVRPSDIVLVKGSRGMRTERFVEFLKKNF